jgi:hypothetical protein
MLKTEFIAMPMLIVRQTMGPFVKVKIIVAFIDFKQLIRTSMLGNTTIEVLVVVVVPIMVLAIRLVEPIMAVAILKLAVAVLELAVIALKPMVITALVVITRQH